MDTTQRLITTLLKAAVTGQVQPLPEGYSLEEAMPIIRKQGLASLAYEGAYVCGISRNEPVMQELFKLYYSILLHSERQMRKVEEVCRAFEENGIDYLPFKGCVLKAMYPRPELRPMGDADILIRFEQYPKICGIMEKLGFSLKSESESEMAWKSDDLCTELHRCLFHPLNRIFYEYYGDGWNRAVHLEGNRYIFCPEDIYIHTFTHYAKHYRGAGIGCRHLLDLWVYRKKNPELNLVYIDHQMEKLGLQKFHTNTLRLLEVWFEGRETDDVVEFMTKRIFSGGVFGNTMDYYVYLELTNAKDTDNIKNARVGYVMRKLFPPLAVIRKRYRIVDRFPILLLFGWVVRWIEILLLHRDRVKNAVIVGKRVSDESLTEYQDALRFVGLDFHG